MTPLDLSLLVLTGLSLTCCVVVVVALGRRPPPVNFTITPQGSDGAVKVTENPPVTPQATKARAGYVDPGRVERQEREARRAVEEAVGVTPVVRTILRSGDPLERDIEVVERYYE